MRYELNAVAADTGVHTTRSEEQYWSKQVSASAPRSAMLVTYLGATRRVWFLRKTGVASFLAARKSV